MFDIPKSFKAFRVGKKSTCGSRTLKLAFDEQEGAKYEDVTSKRGFVTPVKFLGNCEKRFLQIAVRPER